MLIFNIVLFLMLLIIFSRIYISVKNKKERLKGFVLKAWQNGQKKANDIYRKKSPSTLKNMIKSNILLSIAIKNKKGSKSENFELAYLTLAETVSLKYYLDRQINHQLPFIHDDNSINKFVKNEVFSILKDNYELEKYFRKSLVEENIPEKYKEDVLKILEFITDIAKMNKIEEKNNI